MNRYTLRFDDGTFEVIDAPSAPEAVAQREHTMLPYHITDEAAMTAWIASRRLARHGDGLAITRRVATLSEPAQAPLTWLERDEAPMSHHVYIQTLLPGHTSLDDVDALVEKVRETAHPQLSMDKRVLVTEWTAESEWELRGDVEATIAEVAADFGINLYGNNDLNALMPVAK